MIFLVLVGSGWAHDANKFNVVISKELINIPALGFASVNYYFKIFPQIKYFN